MRKNTKYAHSKYFAQKQGFTLAEVLITLGVIGVVAAITIPMLITNSQKNQTVTKLKKTYSVLEQAVKRSEVDNGDLSSWDISDLTNAQAFEKYITPYVTVTAKHASNSLLNDHIYFKQTSGIREEGLSWVRYPVNIYALPGGTDIVTYNANSYPNGIHLLLDLNGITNPPNQFGKDAFILSIYTENNKRLSFMGEYSTSEVTFENDPNRDRQVLLRGGGYTCTKSGRGMWCGHLIKVDGWQIRNDYPW